MFFVVHFYSSSSVATFSLASGDLGEYLGESWEHFFGIDVRALMNVTDEEKLLSDPSLIVYSPEMSISFLNRLYSFCCQRFQRREQLFTFALDPLAAKV